MNAGPKRVGIIIYRYSIGSSSSHINIARLLAKKGYEVTIFLDAQSYDENLVSFQGENITIVPVTKTQALFGDLVVQNHREKPIISFISRMLFFGLKILADTAACIYGQRYSRAQGSLGILLHTSPFLRLIFLREILFAKAYRVRTDKSFDFIIGTDAKGLIVAGLVAGTVAGNIVYYNLELLLESECITAYDKVLKYVERDLNKTCRYTLIPDASRASHLISDNGIAKETILYLPVSALGEPVMTKSDYFRSLFGIGPEKKIVLQAGNIADWTCCYDIARAAIGWPEPFVFVIHTWRTDLEKDPDYLKIRQLVDNKKIYFSSKPVTWDDLPGVLSCADIGVALYKNLGKNFFETGLSSNKIAQYLQAGLPVITSDYPTFREVIDGYRCGKCTNDPGQIARCLEEIFADYEQFRKNAFACFTGVYDFSRNFEKVFLKLKDL